VVVSEGCPPGPSWGNFVSLRDSTCRVKGNSRTNEELVEREKEGKEKGTHRRGGKDVSPTGGVFRMDFLSS